MYHARFVAVRLKNAATVFPTLSKDSSAASTFRAGIHVEEMRLVGISTVFES
jgi:hypothetical protein